MEYILFHLSSLETGTKHENNNELACDFKKLKLDSAKKHHVHFDNTIPLSKKLKSTMDRFFDHP